MPSIVVNGADLFGQDEPPFLILGLGLDLGYFLRAVPLLEKLFGVFAADPRGIGCSSKRRPHAVH